MSGEHGELFRFWDIWERWYLEYMVGYIKVRHRKGVFGIQKVTIQGDVLE